MKSTNGILLVIVLFLAGYSAVQTWNAGQLRDELKELRLADKDNRVIAGELARLRAEKTRLSSQADAVGKEAEHWRSRYREKETVNSRLREDLKRSATELREMAAALRLAKQGSNR